MLLKDPEYIQPGSVEYPNGAFMPEEAIVTTAELRRLAGSLGADVPDFAESFTSLADKVDADSELPPGQDIVQFGDGTRRNYASLLIRFVADHPGALHVIRVKNFPPSEKLTAAFVEGAEPPLNASYETGPARPPHLPRKVGAAIFKTVRSAGTFRRAA
jgi:hypothetical protein